MEQVVRWARCLWIAVLVGLPFPSWAYDLDRLGVPRFIDTVYIDLDRVAQLSKFRSSAGHDYSDGVESCRSMKHYFIAPDEKTAIVAPVSGTITLVQPEFAGTQIQIRPDVQPDFTVILFHVALNASYAPGHRVQEGQSLGTHAGRSTWSDVAVRVTTPQGVRHVSYIEALTDRAFAAFVRRGVSSRSDLVISRAVRDAAPYQCSGQNFTNLPVQADTEFVPLLLPPPVAQASVWGPLQAQRITLMAGFPAAAQFLGGSVFVAALMPPSWNNIIFVWSAGQWSVFEGCGRMPAAYQGALFDGVSAAVIPSESDLSMFVGTQLFIGYGVGSTVQMACEAMLRGGSFARAVTVQ